MRDIKQAFWIAGQNFYGWKKSPRIWMTFILAAILCLMLSDQIISHAIKYETILQVFEPFIWTYGDASSVMLSSLLLILLFADMPLSVRQLRIGLYAQNGRYGLRVRLSM